MGGGGCVVGLSISLKLNVRWLVCVRTCVTFMCALVETEKLFMQSLKREVSVHVRLRACRGRKKNCHHVFIPVCHHV